MIRDPNADRDEVVRGLRELGSKFPPAKRLAYWVTLGVKDRQGERTKQFGGTADPDPSSLAAILPRVINPLDRLMWVLRHTDTLSLDGQTARMIVGDASVAQLLEVVRQAMAKDLVKRWTDQNGEPVVLDPDTHRYHVAGVRMTDEGRAWAKELAEHLDPNLPVESLRL